jgi:hypothetical protein
MSVDSRDPGSRDGLPSEAELLQQARALLPPLGSEPRPGFAGRVAARAAERQAQRGFPWLRWALPTAALAGVAALALVVARPHAQQGPGAELASGDRVEQILQAQPVELAMAERLELYQQLTLVQNEDALEDIDVVARLDQLKPGATP